MSEVKRKAIMELSHILGETQAENKLLKERLSKTEEQLAIAVIEIEALRDLPENYEWEQGYPAAVKRMAESALTKIQEVGK